MVLSHTVKPVGVGSPNPLGLETSPYDGPCRKLSPTSPRCDTYQSPRSSNTDLAVGPPTRGNQAPTIDAMLKFRCVAFAPEERYVYSSATRTNPLKALQRSDNVVLSHTVKPVGVGSPNPLGEETKPLRWMPHRKLSRLSLQRSDMSIAARHVQSPRSRGAQCGIVAHR